MSIDVRTSKLKFCLEQIIAYSLGYSVTGILGLKLEISALGYRRCLNWQIGIEKSYRAENNHRFKLLAMIFSHFAKALLSMLDLAGG